MQPDTTRLMAAVLRDGIRTLLWNAPRMPDRSARRWCEEVVWLTSRDRTEPFAFETICDVLDLDAQWLRARLLLAALGPAPPRSRAAASRG